MLTTNRSFIVALLLNIVTLGIYNWYLIYSFAKETNTACKGDGRSTTGLALYILLSIVTLGIYPFVWMYSWISRCNSYLAANSHPEGLQFSTYILSCFFGWLTLGIWNLVVFNKMLNLQNEVNGVYNSTLAVA